MSISDENDQPNQHPSHITGASGTGHAAGHAAGRQPGSGPAPASRPTGGAGKLRAARSVLTEAMMRGYASEGLTTREVADMHGMTPAWVNYFCNTNCFPQVKLARSRPQPQAPKPSLFSDATRIRADAAAVVIADLCRRGWIVHPAINAGTADPGIIVRRGRIIRTIAVFTGRPSGIAADHHAIADPAIGVYYRPALPE